MMHKELNEKLAAAREQGRLQGIWSSRLTALEEELKETTHQSTMWEQLLQKEYNDVEKLKTASFSNVLYTILQKKEEKLERELLDVLEAKLKFDESMHALERIRQEIEDLKAKLTSVRFWDLAEKEALEQKEKLILQSDTPESQELQKLAKKQAELSIHIKELNEALEAGKSVAAKLNQAKEALSSAKSWGVYDLVGGGILATHAKHNKIDEAMDYIHSAQQSLNRFEKELEDVRIHLSIQMDITSFLRFSDYFFDGLISDWLAQGKVENTLAQVEAKISAINTVLWELQNEKSKAETDAAAAQSAYKKYVEN